jgi:hypothetical protein
MGGLANLLKSITTMMNLPPWAGPLIFFGLVGLSWPFVRVNARTDKARKMIKNASRERLAERERMEADALESVGNHPDGLVAVANQALELGRKDLAGKAVEKLRATGKNLPELRKLERALEPPLPGTPTEACVIIERLISTGMTAEAEARLAQALRKWPLDDDLEALKAKIKPA